MTFLPTSDTIANMTSVELTNVHTYGVLAANYNGTRSLQNTNETELLSVVCIRIVAVFAHIDTSARSLTRDHTFCRIPNNSEPRLHQLPPSRLMHAPVPHT
jgi:hypothetical protein